MKIETPTEACAALAILIVAADELGTIEEREFLFDKVAALPLFASLDRNQFTQLISDTTARMYASLAMDGTRMSPSSVGHLVGMIREALPAERRMEALEAAVGLASADGVVSMEALLLQRLCEGLEIDSESVRRLLGPLA